jgi:hypothetical protein
MTEALADDREWQFEPESEEPEKGTLRSQK